MRLEFFENTGNAFVKLAWSSASQAREIVPRSQLSAPSGVLQASTPSPAPSAGNGAVQNPASGRWYEYVSVPGGITWQQAAAEARSRVFQGRRGYLASVTSAAEKRFLMEQFPDMAKDACWLGGYQDHRVLDYREPAGGWRWVTGDPWRWTDWGAGEPNNGGARGEDFVCVGPSGSWNDTTADDTHPKAYLVKY